MQESSLPTPFTWEAIKVKIVAKFFFAAQGTKNVIAAQ